MKADQLTGMTIMVTRPEASGKQLCHEIEAAGGKAIHCPTIAFKPLLTESALKAALASLETYDWLIFISPQAVSSVASLLSSLKKQLATVRIAAVGPGTKAALAALHFTNIAAPTQQEGSEGLLELPELQSVNQQQIAIIRGDGGRQYLADTLRERGAHVSYVATYQRIIPEHAMRTYQDRLLQGEITAIVCTSYEGIKNLKEMMGDAAWHVLQQMPIVVVSERIKVLAHHLGFQTIWVANNASHDAILETLAQLKEVNYDK